MMKRWLTAPNSIKGATSLLVVTLLLSNILGVVRDHFLAQKITTDLLDTYYASFRLPDLLFNTIILGSVSSAFIPVFSRLISNDKKEEANKLASAIATLGLTVVICLVVVLYFVIPLGVPILVPSFSPEKQAITTQLSRLFLLSPLFFSLSYFLSAIMNSYKRFFVSSLAPLIYNLSIIIATIFFADRFQEYAVAWGVVIGAFLHMAIQFFPVRTLGIHLRLFWDTKMPELREVGRLMLPRSLGLGGLQVMLFVFTAIASGLGAGAVAIYNLADNIQTLPTVVFGTSVASALFPTLTESYSLGKLKDFSNYLEKAVISILFFLIPTSVALILLRIQVVRIVLGSGHFGWEQTILTAETFGFFALSLVFSGLIPLFARAFYALGNTKTPSYYSIFTVVCSIILAYEFSHAIGVPGLALAFSVGSFINCALLYFGLRHKLAEYSELHIGSGITKIFLATIVMAGAIQLVKIALGTIFDLNSFVEVAIQGGLAALLGVITYFGVIYLLGFSEFHFIPFARIFGYFTGGQYAAKK